MSLKREQLKAIEYVIMTLEAIAKSEIEQSAYNTPLAEHLLQLTEILASAKAE